MLGLEDMLMGMLTEDLIEKSGSIKLRAISVDSSTRSLSCVIELKASSRSS
jgi:hypothetical protein